MGHTIVEGMPSTRIIRRSFLVPSSSSPEARDLEAVLGWVKSLLNEWETADDMANCEAAYQETL